MEEETNFENGGTLPLEYQILNGEGTVISGDWKDVTALKAFPVTLQPKKMLTTAFAGAGLMKRRRSRRQMRMIPDWPPAKI